MSGFQTDLLTGLATYLQSNSIGTYSTSTVYTGAQTAIILGNIPQTPDRIVTLTAYPVEDAPAMSDSVIAVQVRTRWGGQDKRPVDDLDDLIFNLLHGATRITLSTGVVIVQCVRNSAATLGQDGNNRWSNVSNYYLTVHRPSTHRT